MLQAVQEVEARFAKDMGTEARERRIERCIYTSHTSQNACDDGVRRPGIALRFIAMYCVTFRMRTLLSESSLTVTMM